MKAIHLAAVGAMLSVTAAAQQSIVIKPPQSSAGHQQFGVDQVCRNLNFYESLKLTVPLLLKLDDRQTRSWKSVEGALTDAKKPVASGCGKLSAMPSGTAATAQAARLEVVLAASLDALRRVRPSFDKFYATLNAVQRQQIDKLFEKSPL